MTDCLLDVRFSLRCYCWYSSPLLRWSLNYIQLGYDSITMNLIQAIRICLECQHQFFTKPWKNPFNLVKTIVDQRRCVISLVIFLSMTWIVILFLIFRHFPTPVRIYQLSNTICMEREQTQSRINIGHNSVGRRKSWIIAHFALSVFCSYLIFIAKHALVCVTMVSAYK